MMSIGGPSLLRLEQNKSKDHRDSTLERREASETASSFPSEAIHVHLMSGCYSLLYHWPFGLPLSYHSIGNHIVLQMMFLM